MAQTGFITVTNLGIGARSDILQNNDIGAQAISNVARPSRLTFAMNSDQTDVTVEIRVQSSAGTYIAMGRSAVPGGGTLGTPPSLEDFGRTVFLPMGTAVVECVGGAAAADINFIYDVQAVA